MAILPTGNRIGTMFATFLFIWIAIAMTLGLFYMAGCTLRAVQS